MKKLVAMRRVVMVTGMQAARKSTIGPLLAARLGPPSAAFDGDVFYRMVAAGNVDLTPDPDPVASMRLALRDTPRRGLWLDASSQKPEETVEAILSDLPASLY